MQLEFSVINLNLKLKKLKSDKTKLEFRLQSNVSSDELNF